MTEILGSKTGIKVLNALFENPLHEFKEIELISSAKTGKGAASGFVNHLIKRGIVICKRAGKTKMINLNLQNEQVLLLKSAFNRGKIEQMPKEILAEIMMFKEKTEDISDMIIAFGSQIAGTSKEDSDLDLLVVAKNPKEVDKKRKEVEEMLGKRINLHLFEKDEISWDDLFARNVLARGVIIHGYSLAFKLIKSKQDTPKIENLINRQKAALRNLLHKDLEASDSIVENIIEQLAYFILSEKEIGYASKKDALDSLRKIPEGRTIENIKKLGRKQRIEQIGNFLAAKYTNMVLGYG